MKLKEALDRMSWDDALRVIANNLVDGAHLDYLFSGEVEASDIAEELLDGRWIDQLNDILVDELIVRKENAVGDGE